MVVALLFKFKKKIQYYNIQFNVIILSIKSEQNRTKMKNRIQKPQNSNQYLLVKQLKSRNIYISIQYFESEAS
ncbi:unnamed protein product [Paramecium sonneborni]|uniref:Uncharacterized protein n=1 Tax=Paramecium sonneborni TaxID=65129 RepID=A0A8S1K6T5_9CILI|nr:unnamed protein product [Paramecium sonneborni]